MEIRRSLEIRIEELERERVQLRETLIIIREKIAKADEKYRADHKMTSYHKWSTILSGLEEELDRTRALLVSCEAELDETRRKLSERLMRVDGFQYASEKYQDLPQKPAGVEGSSPESTEAISNETVFAASSRDEAEGLPDETVSSGFSHAASALDSVRNEPRIATVSAPHASGAGTLEAEAVTAGMEKIARGRVRAVTLDEIEQMVDRYVTLLHRPSPTPQEQELERSLADSLLKADRELGRLRRKWIPYAPIEPG